MPAMHLNYHRDGCFADETLIAFYTERARGRAGLISIGGFAVDQAGAGVFKSLLLGLWNDDFIPDLKPLIRSMKAVHPDGMIACQLYHTGRVSPSRITGLRPVGASEIASRFNPEPVHALTTEEVRALERKYVEAAVRAIEIGFECIDIFCGVGHLLSQFLSPSTNNRSDEYGGSLANRARIVVNIITGTRARLPGVPILARMAGHDLIPNGNTHREAAEIAQLLEAAGADAFNVTGGWHELRNPADHRRRADRRLCLARPDRQGRGVGAGGGRQPDQRSVRGRAGMNSRDGQADFVSMGRPLLADPYLPRKLIDGQIDQINHCIACNVCLDTAWSGPARCLVNPAAGREAELSMRPVSEQKHVVVVGGGPGGMMAAKVAATRGHRVTLYERNPTLGGIAAIGDIAPGKKEYRWLYEDLARQIGAHPLIELRVGCEATLQKLRDDKPEAVIVATGGKPFMLALPGLDSSPIPVVHAHEVLAGETGGIGNDVVIVGGGPTACETALYLKEEGGLDAETVKFLLVHQLMDVDELRQRASVGHPKRNVSIVQRSGKLAKDLNKSVRWTLLQQIEQAGVVTNVNASIASIGKDTVTIVGADRSVRDIRCDTLVVAAGIAADDNLYSELRKTTSRTRRFIWSAMPLPPGRRRKPYWRVTLPLIQSEADSTEGG